MVRVHPHPPRLALFVSKVEIDVVIIFIKTKYNFKIISLLNFLLFDLTIASLTCLRSEMVNAPDF